MSARRKRASLLGSLALVGAFSCSVFPDEATLPLGAGALSGAAGAGVAGSSVLPSGGEGVEPTALGGAGASEGGAPAVGGAGAPPLGMGGVPDTVGGAGGAAACGNVQQRVLLVTDDTWIESAKPAMSHGNDAALSVVGGGQERRALLEVTLPAAPAGAVLLDATLVLQLQANADASLAPRQLRLHQLTQQVLEGRANWNNYDNGAKGKWLSPGGDFGGPFAPAAVPAGTVEGALTFNVTAVARNTFAATSVPLSLILMETGAPPPAPADLTFTSSEGDASGVRVPALILEYCEP